MVDTGRNFLTVTTLKMALDAMSYTKLNVRMQHHWYERTAPELSPRCMHAQLLHWHLVDDQSFAIDSKALPKLAGDGAFSPRHTYSLADLQVFRRRMELEIMHKPASSPQGLGSENRRPGDQGNDASPPTKNWSKHALVRSTERGVPVRRLGSIRAMPVEHKGGALLHKDPDINATYLCRDDTVVTVYR